MSVPRAGVEPARPFGQRILKSRAGALTYSYQTIQASIYAPSGRQGIASAGFVSTRTVTILAPSTLVALLLFLSKEFLKKLYAVSLTGCKPTNTPHE
jgi:hypothetical protein